KRPLEITLPSSLSQPSSYGCDKCPHYLVSSPVERGPAGREGRMRRRDFVAGLGALAVPLSARGQQLKVSRIGLLLGASAERAASLFHSLKEGLRKRG